VAGACCLGDEVIGVGGDGRFTLQIANPSEMCMGGVVASWCTKMQVYI
jgi:hypothetical protein